MFVLHLSPAVTIFVLLFATLTGTASAQEEDDSAFDRRIDAAVEKVFHSIDDELGSYIFTDTPAIENTQRENKETPTEDSDSFDDAKQYRGRKAKTAAFRYQTEVSYDFANRHFPRNSTLAYPWEHINNDMLFRYNRVEGLFLGLNNPKSTSWDRHRIDLFGSGGYGFASHRWRYDGGVAQQFGSGMHMFEFGGEGHSITDSDDQWRIGQAENNVAALITRDDYRDYFGRAGYSLWLGVQRMPAGFTYRVQAAYLHDNYTSLEQNTNWSVFGGDKLFRDNPAIDEGNMHSIAASIELQNIRQRQIHTTGWSAAVSTEIAGGGIGGDFTFNRYLLDLRRYQSFGTYDNLNIRLRAGAATGTVPVQKLLAIGGMSTLPAFGYKEFSGNRLLLANAEYVVNGKMFDDDDLFPSWLLQNVNLIVFYDAGYAGTSSESSPVAGFNPLNATTLKSDWGIGIGSRDAKFRLGCAWRTDVAERGHVFLRLDRPF